MAIATLIAASHVNLVTEYNRFNVLLGRKVEFDRFEDGMTLLAVTRNSKGIFAIMAESAGQSLFHVTHGVSLVDFSRDKGLIMTVIATI